MLDVVQELQGDVEVNTPVTVLTRNSSGTSVPPPSVLETMTFLLTERLLQRLLGFSPGCGPGPKGNAGGNEMSHN